MIWFLCQIAEVLYNILSLLSITNTRYRDQRTEVGGQKSEGSMAGCGLFIEMICVRLGERERTRQSSRYAIP
jgi:hypothetical protein